MRIVTYVPESDDRGDPSALDYANAFEMTIGDHAQVQRIRTESDAQHLSADAILWFGPLTAAPLKAGAPVFPVISSGPDSKNPNQSWHSIVTGWQANLQHAQRAIVPSKSISKQIRSLAGPEVDVFYIVPITPSSIEFKNQSTSPATYNISGLSVDGPILDSWSLLLSPDLLIPKARPNEERRISKVQLPSQQFPGQSMPISAYKLRTSGIVYFAQFDPLRDDINWRDLLSAFCWTFRNVGGATLLVHLQTNDVIHARLVFLQYLYKLAAFKCRIVAFNCSLGSVELDGLVRISHYLVHLPSTNAFFCTPLAFISRGVPAIASDIACLTEFSGENQFVVRTIVSDAFEIRQELESCFATYKVNWRSLCNAFEESYKVARDADKYSRLAHDTITALRATSDASEVSTFLQHVSNISKGAET